jgi:glyoxylase-like metal-dependent hydrolase (beta-lactamase superfamily II)
MEVFSIRPVSKDLRMAVRQFVIRLTNDLVLLDCGLGLPKNGDFMITSLLEQHSIKPNQITKVLLSHLHKDHIEGLGYFQNGSFLQHFPNATIYVSKQELNYALSQKGNPSFNDDLAEQLAQLPNLKLINAQQGNIMTWFRFGLHFCGLVNIKNFNSHPVCR